LFNVASLDIGGYIGDPGLWNPINGANSKIRVSIDGHNWETIGTLPPSYGNSIQKLKFQRVMRFKYIQFINTTYVGIGYLKLITGVNNSNSVSTGSTNLLGNQINPNTN
jgi:hypothetical protein